VELGSEKLEDWLIL